MAISEHLASHTGTVRLLFASDEPFTLEALQTMFDRHTHVIERLEREHAARTTVEAGLAVEGFALRMLRRVA
jgi:hypothetical protein